MISICNLWVNPETSEYEVDRCNHPISELIPVIKQQTPLTHEQIESIGKLLLDHGFHEWEGLQPWVHTFVKAVEVSHGIQK